MIPKDSIVCLHRVSAQAEGMGWIATNKIEAAKDMATDGRLW